MFKFICKKVNKGCRLKREREIFRKVLSKEDPSFGKFVNPQ